MSTDTAGDYLRAMVREYLRVIRACNKIGKTRTTRDEFRAWWEAMR